MNGERLIRRRQGLGLNSFWCVCYQKRLRMIRLLYSIQLGPELMLRACYVEVVYSVNLVLFAEYLGRLSFLGMVFFGRYLLSYLNCFSELVYSTNSLSVRVRSQGPGHSGFQRGNREMDGERRHKITL